MKPILLGSLFVLTLSLGLFAPQLGVAKETKHDVGNQYKVTQLDLNKQDKQKELPKHQPNDLKLKHLTITEGHGGTTNRSVPIPGTELLLGGALAGIVYWRARQKRA